MRTRLAPLLAALLASSVVSAAVAQTLTAAPTVEAAAASACGTTPKAPPCNRYVCTPDGWEPQPLADGTACNDGNLCTYGDHCDTGSCYGTPIDCTAAGPCETKACNGTSACAVTRPAAGTACPVATDNPCEAVCDGSSPQCQPL